MADLTTTTNLCFNYFVTKSKHKNPLFSTFHFRLLMVITIVALSLLGTKNIIQNYQSSNVLGETSHLASKGSDSLENSGDSNSGSGSSDSDVNDDSNVESNEREDEVENEVEDEIEPTDTPEQEDEDEENLSQFSFENLKELRVRTEENKTKIRIDSTGGRFELENENGRLKIKIKQENGDEVELENDTLDDINEALEEEDIHVATTSGRGFRIRRGEFEAETRFPLSINPTTNQLTVTTPAGEKDVAVLPDQAVANLLRMKFIDKVASDSATGTSQNISLGLLNDEPTFQVKGLDDQKLLGFLPVSIQKISFVSAQTGQVIKIDETFLNRLLDLFSIQ